VETDGQAARTYAAFVEAQQGPAERSDLSAYAQRLPVGAFFGIQPSEKSFPNRVGEQQLNTFLMSG